MTENRMVIVAMLPGSRYTTHWIMGGGGLAQCIMASCWKDPQKVLIEREPIKPRNINSLTMSKNNKLEHQTPNRPIVVMVPESGHNYAGRKTVYSVDGPAPTLQADCHDGTKILVQRGP